MSARTLFGVVALAALLSGHGSVHAVPASPSTPDAVTVDLAALRGDLAKARARTPATFVAMASFRAEVPSLDAKKRGPLAVLAPTLERIAARPDGWSALVETLVDDLDGATLAPSARTALRASIAETLGRTRDRRGTPILASLLTTDPEPMVVRAAAFGLARLQDDASLAALLPWVTAKSDRQVSVVIGAGSCRRNAMASALASVLAGSTDAVLSRAAIDALGTLGAKWAWQTGDVHDRKEEAPSRETAARALLAAYVQHTVEPELRLAAANALLMVDAAGTPGWIAAAKATASPAAVSELDALAARFAKNPAR